MFRRDTAWTSVQTMSCLKSTAVPRCDRQNSCSYSYSSEQHRKYKAIWLNEQVKFLFYLPWNPIFFLLRWGGMISTPDAVLQAMIKRSLQESGCPVHIVTELMENAHERRWPPGLQTLETRQMNRRWNFCVYLQSPHENPNFRIHDIETDPYLLQAIWAIHSSEDSREAGGGGDGLWQHTHQWWHDPRTWHRDDICPWYRVVVITRIYGGKYPLLNRLICDLKSWLSWC